MHEISFLSAELAVTAVWPLVRISIWKRQNSIDWKREAVLLLMYINLAVIIRFVFFPRDLVDGHVQPLVFEAAAVFPLRINLIPLVYIFDYDSIRDIIWNVVGNAVMFIPSGIILPFINTILSLVIGGNPLPLGGGRSLVNSWPLTLALNVLLYSS